jgi:PAS domain S-box-containing protein
VRDSHTHAEDDLPLAAKVEEHPLRLAPEVAARLSESEQAAFFCTLVDAALDAIIAHWTDGSIIWANRGATDLLGYSSQEMMELMPYAWVEPRQLKAAPRRIESLLRDGHLTFVSAVRRKDGEVLRTEVTTRRVDTALGPAVVAVIRELREGDEAL